MDSVSVALAGSIARAFRRHVVDEALPRLRRCVELLDEQQIWARHGRHGNSVGNLLLHLEGNVRQWILCGVGGAEDRRDRDGEFAADAARGTGAELMDRLDATAREAAAVIDRTTAAQMVEVRSFQNRYEREVAGAILHVLEHFSGHTYQIYAFTKQAKDLDLHFWPL